MEPASTSHCPSLTMHRDPGLRNMAHPKLGLPSWAYFARLIRPFAVTLQAGLYLHIDLHKAPHSLVAVTPNNPNSKVPAATTYWPKHHSLKSRQRQRKIWFCRQP